MDKGYRVKVNGVYNDEAGWQGWEVIGFSVLDFCEHYYNERKKGNPLYIVAGKAVCKGCF